MPEETSLPDSESAALANTVGAEGIVGFGPDEYDTALQGIDKRETSVPVDDDDLIDPESAPNPMPGQRLPGQPGAELVEETLPVAEPPVAKTPLAETTPPPEPQPETKPAEEKTEKPFWDAKRQQRDQEIANLRKQNKELKTKLAGADVGGVRDMETINAELAELQAQPLDEFTPPEQLVATSKKLIALTSELAKSQVAEHRNTADQEALDAVLTDVCGDENVGAKYRNEIVRGLNAAIESQGYGPGNWPSSSHVRELCHRIGLQLAMKDKSKAVPAPKAAKPPTLDRATGASNPAAPAKSGRVPQFRTNDEALAYIIKQGQAR